MRHLSQGLSVGFLLICITIQCLRGSDGIAQSEKETPSLAFNLKLVNDTVEHCGFVVAEAQVVNHSDREQEISYLDWGMPYIQFHLFDNSGKRIYLVTMSATTTGGGRPQVIAPRDTITERYELCGLSNIEVPGTKLWALPINDYILYSTWLPNYHHADNITILTSDTLHFSVIPPLPQNRDAYGILIQSGTYDANRQFHQAASGFYKIFHDYPKSTYSERALAQLLSLTRYVLKGYNGMTCRDLSRQYIDKFPNGAQVTSALTAVVRSVTESDRIRLVDSLYEKNRGSEIERSLKKFYKPELDAARTMDQED